MRLRNIRTLKHCIQEVGAESVMLQLPGASRKLVTVVSSFFEIVLKGKLA